MGKERGKRVRGSTRKRVKERSENQRCSGGQSGQFSKSVLLAAGHTPLLPVVATFFGRG